MGFLTARHRKFQSSHPFFSLSLSGPVRTRAGWHHFQPPWCRTLRRGERRQLWWLRWKNFDCFHFQKNSYTLSSWSSFCLQAHNLKAGLVDTVALLAWTAASLEDGDKHSLATSVSIYFLICIWYLKMDSLATSESFFISEIDLPWFKVLHWNVYFFQALAAAQVLTVRNNRGTTSWSCFKIWVPLLCFFRLLDCDMLCDFLICTCTYIIMKYISVTHLYKEAFSK